MAHVQHYKAGDVKRLCNEYGREFVQDFYKNEDERTFIS